MTQRSCENQAAVNHCGLGCDQWRTALPPLIANTRTLVVGTSSTDDRILARRLRRHGINSDHCHAEAQFVKERLPIDHLVVMLEPNDHCANKILRLAEEMPEIGQLPIFLHAFYPMGHYELDGIRTLCDNAGWTDVTILSEFDLSREQIAQTILHTVKKI